MDLKELVRVVEDIVVAAATHVRAVVRHPELIALIELQAVRISQAPRHHLVA